MLQPAPISRSAGKFLRFQLSPEHSATVVAPNHLWYDQNNSGQLKATYPMHASHTTNRAIREYQITQRALILQSIKIAEYAENTHFTGGAHSRPRSYFLWIVDDSNSEALCHA